MRTAPSTDHDDERDTKAPSPDSARRDRRIDLALLLAAVLSIGLLGARGSGLLGGDEAGDGARAPAADEEAEGERSDDSEDFALVPTPGPAPLDWAPGIQTWLHWYHRGIGDPQLRNLDAQGFGWVKQRFAWADMQPVGQWSEASLRRYLDRYGGEDYPSFGPIDWAHSDAYLDAIDRVAPGTHVLIQLDVTPEWARWEDYEDLTPGELPFDTEAWWGFVYFFAQRYAGRVHAYEIGNEPNLRHPDSWPSTPDPEAYAWMLHDARSAIKEADPHALVLSAGLSPTGDDGMPDAMADDIYLEALYDSMEEQYGTPDTGGTASDHYFDAVGAHAPGFRAAPEVSPDEAATDPELGGQRFFTFRRVEDLRAIMDGRGDGEKPIVITELSWTTDPRPESPYHWSAVDEETRADYIVRAFDYAAENWGDWIGPIFLFSAPDRAWTGDHEAYWRAVTDDAGRLTHGAIGNLWAVPSPTQRTARHPAEQDAEETDMRSDPEAEEADSEPLDGQHVNARLGVDPTATELVLELAIDNQNDHPTLWTGGAPSALAIRDGRLALGTGHRLRLADISDPSAPRWLYESEPFPGRIESLVWDPGERASLLVSGAFGLQILDVSDLESPILIGSVPTAMRILSTSAGHAFAEQITVCADDVGTERACSVIQTYDLGALPAPEPVGAFPLPKDATWTVHDGYLYIVRDDGTRFVLDAYDLLAGPNAHANAAIGRVAFERPIEDVVTHGQGIAVILDDPDPIDDLPSGHARVAVLALDVDDPANMQPRGETLIKTTGRWRAGTGHHIAVMDSTCELDACHMSTRLIDLTDPDDPRLIPPIFATGFPSRVLAMAEGWSNAGAAWLAVHEGVKLSIYEIPDAAAHVESAWVPHGSLPLPLLWTQLAALEDGTQVAAGGRQLQLLEPFASTPYGEARTPVILGNIEDLGCHPGHRTGVRDLAIVGETVLIAGWESGLIVVDAGDPTAPTTVGCHFDAEIDALGLAVDTAGFAQTNELLVYLASLDHDRRQVVLNIIDLTIPDQPALLSSTPIEDTDEPALVVHVAAAGGRVFIGLDGPPEQGRPNLFALDVSDPYRPIDLDIDAPASGVTSITSIGDLVAVGRRVGCAPLASGAANRRCNGRVDLFQTPASAETERAQTSTPIAPRAQIRLAEPAPPRDVLLLPGWSEDEGRELWIGSEFGLWIVNVDDPLEPILVEATREPSGGVYGLVRMQDGGVLVAGHALDRGLSIRSQYWAQQ